MYIYYTSICTCIHTIKLQLAHITQCPNKRFCPSNLSFSVRLDGQRQCKDKAFIPHGLQNGRRVIKVNREKGNLCCKPLSENVLVTGQNRTEQVIFAVNIIGKDKVLPRANVLILSRGDVFQFLRKNRCTYRRQVTSVPRVHSITPLRVCINVTSVAVDLKDRELGVRYSLGLTCYCSSILNRIILTFPSNVRIKSLKCDLQALKSIFAKGILNVSQFTVIWILIIVPLHCKFQLCLQGAQQIKFIGIFSDDGCFGP